MAETTYYKLSEEELLGLLVERKKVEDISEKIGNILYPTTREYKSLEDSLKDRLENFSKLEEKKESKEPKKSFSDFNKTGQTKTLYETLLDDWYNEFMDILIKKYKDKNYEVNKPKNPFKDTDNSKIELKWSKDNNCNWESFL